MINQTIAVDFDGVIHAYSNGWQDGSIYDEPIKDAFASIEKIMELGFSVFILSTREPKQIKKWIDKQNIIYSAEYDTHFKNWRFDTEIINDKTKFWNKQNVLGITNKKLPAIIYIDDRGYKFRNWCVMDILKQAEDRKIFAFKENIHLVISEEDLYRYLNEAERGIFLLLMQKIEASIVKNKMEGKP